LTGSEQKTLEALRWDWGDAYEIGLGDRQWHARRKDGKGALIEAPTPDDLRKQIVEDYTFMPVPRDLNAAIRDRPAGEIR
jgi:hypothetical protein